MSKEFNDCECEEDISHFLHNLGYFHKELLKRAPDISLSTEQVLSLFNVWLKGIVEEEPSPSNPLNELFKQMFGQANASNTSSDHPFSFRLYDDEEDED